MERTFEAPAAIREMIARLGRTEDLRFSPSGRLIALAGFRQNRIALLEVCIAPDGAILIPRAAEIASSALNQPHGIDFLDEGRIVVANRSGAAPVFRLPPLSAEPRGIEIDPLAVIPADGSTGISTPGSVAAVPEDGGHVLFFCNNYANTVTRHLLDAEGQLLDSRLILRRNLSTPDGIAISPDRRWLAISNHDTQSILVYALDRSPGPESEPDATLRGPYFPHGLRFTADGRHLVAADGGKPFIHIYPRLGGGWRGKHFPTISQRVMPEEVFRSGSYNEAEGGPKGIDIAPGNSVLAVTSRHQPLAFFDLAGLLELSDAYAALRGGVDLKYFQR